MNRVAKLIKWFNDEEYTLQQCVDWVDDHKNQYSVEELNELLLRLQYIYGCFIGKNNA